MTRALRVLLLGVALGLVLAGTAGAVPRTFFGLQAWRPPPAHQFTTLGAAGIGSFRAHLNWSQVEPERGARDWSFFDAQVRNAAAAGLTIQPMLLGSPKWAAPRPQTPPSTAAGHEAFMRFASDAVARYGPGGAFWRENPSLPQRAPRHWQIWNEPNLPIYWKWRPDAAEYIAFVREARARIRSVDPGAKIVLAGLPNTKKVPGLDFLRAIYAVPRAASAFDVVAMHPYAHNHRDALGYVRSGRDIMRAAGDGKTPIWITEIGWSTGGEDDWRFTTDERGQARRVRNVMRGVLRRRTALGIKMIVWFSLNDRAPDAGEPNWWGLHTGLFRRDGSAKPAWNALRRYTRR